MKIHGVTALVTGANRGIGQQLVMALLQAGAAKVYAAARNMSSLDVTVAFNPGRVVPLMLDVTSPAQIETTMATASDVRLLINNAAVLEFGDARALSPAVLRTHFEVNVHGLFGMSQAFAQMMRDKGEGAVVNILSDIALTNAPGAAAYSASKAAAWSLTQSLRAALQRYGIAVHAAFPGPVDTDMLAMLNIPKSSAIQVAKAIVSKVQADELDIFP